MTDEEIQKLESQLKSWRRWFHAAVPFAIIGCLMFFVIVSKLFNEVVLSQKVSLTDEVDTIAEFAEEMPPPEKIVLAERNGSGYFFVYGSTRTVLASSSPVYVFDSQGNLVIWNSDVGEISDTHPWWRYFSKAKQIRPVSLKEAVEIAAKNNQ